MSKCGFTLIELVMIIVILGILAAVAIPKYFDLQSEAKDAAENGVVGGVRAGIHTYYAKNRSWPGTLDSASDGSATKTNVFFDDVLVDGVTSGWSKSGTTYTGPASGEYDYDLSDGSFTEQ